MAKPFGRTCHTEYQEGCEECRASIQFGAPPSELRYAVAAPRMDPRVENPLAYPEDAFLAVIADWRKT